MESSDIKNAGLKLTLPRMKILELLEKSDNRHLKAEDIYKMLLDSGEEIALATVYRVLTQFETAGLVTRHHFEGGHAVFELNEVSTMTTWSIFQLAGWSNFMTKLSSNVNGKLRKNITSPLPNTPWSCMGSLTTRTKSRYIQT